MSIKIDLYDLFAYTIPGGFYLFSILYICNLLGFINIDINQINNSSAWLIFVSLALAYTIGHVFEPFARVLERQINLTKGRAHQALNNFKSNKQDMISFHFEAQDTPILRAFITKHCSELGDKIDRNGAMRTMLRNLALNFLLLSVVFIIQTIILWNGYYLAVSLISLAMAFLSMKESDKFSWWFYHLTYQSVVALSLTNNDLVQHRQQKKEHQTEQELLSHLLHDNRSKGV